MCIRDSPCEGIDEDEQLNMAAKEKKKRQLIREAAMTDASEDGWMRVRVRINDVLEGVVPLLSYLGDDLYNKLCRKALGEVPQLYRLTERPILEVIASVVDLLAFYGELSLIHISEPTRPY
eukprot:TRINITY_DN16175_c0_g1_i1.p1 TRINITY_DN16175_c0_g1~~TRINITY_DN16175_c0_g1_i1.p1  ORF type:complete len:121 (+),score=58.16 TRINITY_DN16175_c0_g1_i1:186-548(+)